MVKGHEMASSKAAQWEDIAERFHEEAKSRKKVLAYHFDPHQRGWLAGMQLGHSTAASFAVAAKAENKGIPAELRHPMTDAELFYAFVDYLLSEVSRKEDELDAEIKEEFYEDDELTEYRKGRLVGLNNLTHI